MATDAPFQVVTSDERSSWLVAQLASLSPPPNSDRQTQQTYACPLTSGNQRRRCHPSVGAKGWPKGRVRQEFWLHPRDLSRMSVLLCSCSVCCNSHIFVLRP